MPSGKYLAGGLQSGCTANSIGVQYTLFHVGDIIIEVLRKFGESAKYVHLRERNIRKTDNPYGNGTTE